MAVPVTMTDPVIGTRGAVIYARVRGGLLVSAYSAGWPVYLQFNHGKAEIVSFG
jgi:hypothetical protein